MKCLTDVLELCRHHDASFQLIHFQRAYEFDISFNPQIFIYIFFNGYPRRHSVGLFDTKFLAFTSLTCWFVLYASHRLPRSSLCWYPDTAAASVEQEMKEFPPNLSLWPFITPKPEVPAMAASPFYNELILHDRIPSYLDREGRSHSARLLSLFLAPPACSVHITVTKIHREVLDLLSSHYRRGDDKVKGTEKRSSYSLSLSMCFYSHAMWPARTCLHDPSARLATHCICGIYESDTGLMVSFGGDYGGFRWSAFHVSGAVQQMWLTNRMVCISNDVLASIWCCSHVAQSEKNWILGFVKVILI